MLLTVSDPQEITPLTPVRDRFGAESRPSTEAPFVTVWESEGTSAGRATMASTTAETVIPEQELSPARETVLGPGMAVRA